MGPTGPSTVTFARRSRDPEARPWLARRRRRGPPAASRRRRFGDDHLDNPYLERRLQAGNGTGSNGGCLRNAWGKSQICDFDDENCKYKLPEACTSKFTCPAGYYCTAGAYDPRVRETRL